MDKFYIKHFAERNDRSLYIENNEPILEYITAAVNRLLSSSTALEVRNSKIDILKDFEDIYKFDLKHATMPKMFGHFDSKQEYEALQKKKILLQDFAYYLGNIFICFHQKMFLKTKSLPLLRAKQLMQNYGELYDKEASDYLANLFGAPIRIKDSGEIIYKDEQKEGIVRETKEYNGEICQNKCSSAFPSETNHALSASFILPSLIEHFLGNALENQILSEGLNKLKFRKIEWKDWEEKQIVESLCGTPKDRISFNATKSYVLGRLYHFFVRNGIMEAKLDNELMFTGICCRKDRKVRRMLGDILSSRYAMKRIRPEYLFLLRAMFNGDKLNLRNNIMHGSSETFDYFDLRFVAVMYQIIWDISSGDLFQRD